MNEQTQLTGRGLDLALARALGVDTLEGGIRPDGDNTFAIRYFSAPHYSTDLNAVHEVEAELQRRGLGASYADKLTDELIADGWKPQGNFGYLYGDLTFDDFFALLHATSEQRARAALKVLPQ